MKKYLLILVSLIATGAYAETTQVVQDDILQESSDILKCRPTTTPPAVTNIEIKPTLNLPTDAPAVTYEDLEAPVKDLSPTEKLKAYRQKLEEKNLVLLEKKMEMIRLQQEMALLRNLERSMNQTLTAINGLQL
jgi:uncharacterized protein with ParB-like and HNH nuclease domain